MPKKIVNAKGHQRKLSDGRTVPVKPYNRSQETGKTVMKGNISGLRSEIQDIINEETELEGKIISSDDLKHELNVELYGLTEKENYLDSELKNIQKEKDKYIAEHGYSDFNTYHKNFIKRRENSIYGKLDRIRAKRGELESIGMSTKRKNMVMKELTNPSKFTSIKIENDIMGGKYTKIGYVKDLGYVRVDMKRWSGLMGNVRGMKSLANKKDINKIGQISEKEYNNLKEGKKTKTTSFMGAEETIEFK